MTETRRLFTPIKIGPLELRNRSVRSAAFEGMCPGALESLRRYHHSVAAGGIGMTTVAYAAVTPGGRPCEPCNRCIAVMYFGEARCTEAERLLAGRRGECPVAPPPEAPGPAAGPSATAI